MVDDFMVCVDRLIASACFESVNEGLERTGRGVGADDFSFAHRKCIQKWCNKKGDITCEICNQVYAPNYTLPPARINPDGMAIDIRQTWGPRIDLRDPRFLALAAAEHQLLQSEYEDYAVANTGSIACFRSVALILMLVLLVRHALMVTRDSEMVQESSTFFNVSLLWCF
ncbi:hypothetical protein HHK36_022018 [Tetracentron sinense]|uniref:RING-CH-type domain-containing protein n=1 Tax=Tetracentron sinense TaxID=13715 RepID=A0A834YMF8_TETSI|nr:hypothetical protein HHK36_022018 [Tetracentron sinense]